MTEHTSLTYKAFRDHHAVRYLASALHDKVVGDHVHADKNRILLAGVDRTVAKPGDAFNFRIRTDIHVHNVHRIQDFDVLADDTERNRHALHVFRDHSVQGFCQCRFVSVKC